jgi:glycosyltransferase involved in cell wall biosynthesis
MQSERKRKVAFAYPPSFQYRVKFHILLRDSLAKKNIEYCYIYDSKESLVGRKDTVNIPWAKDAPQLKFPVFGYLLKYHCIGAFAKDCDLLILQQENSLIANYYWQIRSSIIGPKVAFFGHGKNFQSRNPDGLAERWKRFWATKVSWWFAYTETCADIVKSYGFPMAKISVFNNSIDIHQIELERNAIEPKKLERIRKISFENSQNIAIYVGAIYPDKRPDFLIRAAIAIRAQVPDFQLLVIGGGPEAHLIERAAADHDWIHALGPKFGLEKTELVSLAKVWLLPGLVGLAVLDSFVYEVPMITTNLSFHSPEIDYLINGENGLILDDPEDVEAYARSAVKLLTDTQARLKLVEGCRRSKNEYSIEKMALRFADGVLIALE